MAANKLNGMCQVIQVQQKRQHILHDKTSLATESSRGGRLAGAGEGRGRESREGERAGRRKGEERRGERRRRQGEGMGRERRESGSVKRDKGGKAKTAVQARSKEKYRGMG